MSKIFSKIKAIWSGLRDKEARDEYVAARLDTDLAFQIYSLRKQRGWTQTELARRCGNPNGQGAICRLESSAEGVSVSTLRELASAFDVALSIKFVAFSQLVEDSIGERLDRTVPSFTDDKVPAKFAPLLSTFSTTVVADHRKLDVALASRPWVNTTLAAQSKPLVGESVRAN